MDEIARQQKRRCVEGPRAVICVSESTGLVARRFTSIQIHKMHVVYNAYSQQFRVRKDPSPVLSTGGVQDGRA